MSKLEILIDDVLTLKKVMAIDPEIGDPRARCGREAAKGAAVLAMPTAMEALRKELMTKTICVLPSGPLADQHTFATVAQEEVDTITIDVSVIYMRITSRVFEMVGPQLRFSLNNSMDTVSIIKEEARELGLERSLTGVFDTELYFKDLTDLYDFIKSEIRKVWGDALTKAYVEKEILERVVAVGYKYSVVGVVLVGTNEKERIELSESLCNGNNFIVPILNQPTKERVIKVFKQLQGQAKQNLEGNNQ